MRRHFLLLTLLPTLLASCIEKYDAELPESETKLLCVEGSITGNSTNTFYLSSTMSLKETWIDIDEHKIDNAQITVKGSDGTSYQSKSIGSGAYTVEVATLQKEEEYWLEIDVDGLHYQSTPQQPLDSLSITGLTFDMPHEEESKVNLLISAQAPTQPDEEQYFRWTYHLFYEVRTPLSHTWDYFVENDSIATAVATKSRGFCEKENHDILIGTNTDFRDNHLEGFRVFSKENNDNCFNYLCCIRVSQTAISPEEYQYYRLSQLLNQEMGGLFTPQPSELPSNVYCTTDASRHVIGFVGVSIGSASRDLYIRSSEVGYKLTKQVKSIDESETDMSRKELYESGYRLYKYDLLMQPPMKLWASRWGLDCTDPYWGGSLEFPEWWPNL